MIHERLPTLTETAFGSHPCCVVSVTYVKTHCFHGGNTGANPVGDAKPFQNLSWPACARGHPRLLPNRISIGKIVLLCKPRSPLRDKSFFLARFVVGLIFVLAIRWMRILRTGE